MKLMGAVVLLTLVGTQNAIHRHGGSIGTMSPVSTGWPARYQHQATSPAGVTARIHPFFHASTSLPSYTHIIFSSLPPYLLILYILYASLLHLILIHLISLHYRTMHLSNSFSPSTYNILFPPFCIRV